MREHQAKEQKDPEGTGIRERMNRIAKLGLLVVAAPVCRGERDVARWSVRGLADRLNNRARNACVALSPTSTILPLLRTRPLGEGAARSSLTAQLSR